MCIYLSDYQTAVLYSILSNYNQNNKKKINYTYLNRSILYRKQCCGYSDQNMLCIKLYFINWFMDVCEILTNCLRCMSIYKYLHVRYKIYKIKYNIK